MPRTSAKTDAPLTVTQAAGLIQRTIQQAIPGRIRVLGEISSLSARTHWYFTLKDRDASLRCACFASSAQRVPFQPDNGMAVIATGRIDFYPPQGSLQMIVDSLEVAGQGDLEAELRRRVAELRELGYFDEGRKKPLPLIPTRVAVVTSGAGAALQDVIDTTRRRWPAVQLLLVDVPVQGAAAAPAITKAIEQLSRHAHQLNLDAIILTRGGGSMEDLWAFNERSIADAIFRCPIPFVAAIGHEVDTTIAELVADARAATPTQAAMQLIPDRAALDRQVDQQARRLSLLTQREVERQQDRLNAVARSTIFRQPDHWLASKRDHLVRLSDRLRLATRQGATPHRQHLNRLTRDLARSTHQRLEDATHRLSTLAPQLHREINRRLDTDSNRFYALTRQLEAVGPKQVLGRGFTYTLGPDGKPLRSAEAAKAVGKLRTVFKDGEVKSTIDDAPPKPKKRRQSSADTTSLFDPPEPA
ncbi:MAG: exodeoxyribonuclease VII large subunit [Phycisphaeraceae bacterium]